MEASTFSSTIVAGCDLEAHVEMLEEFSKLCGIAPTEMRSWRTVCAHFRSLSTSTALARRRWHAPRSASRCALESANLTQASMTLQRSAREQSLWCGLRTGRNAVKKTDSHSASRTLRARTITNQISWSICFLFFLSICTWHSWRKGRGTFLWNHCGLPSCGLSHQSWTNNQRYLSLPRGERQEHSQHPAGDRRSRCSVKSRCVSTRCTSASSSQRWIP